MKQLQNVTVGSGWIWMFIEYVLDGAEAKWSFDVCVQRIYVYGKKEGMGGYMVFYFVYKIICVLVIRFQEKKVCIK